MALTRTDDKLDKNITRLLMQSPLGLTIGDITAAAKCTPQTARKSLARIGAEKDASGMLYVLRDDDEQAAPAPEQAAPEPAPEAQMPKRSKLRTVNWGGDGFLNPYADTSPTEPTDPAPAAAEKPLRRGDLVVSNGDIYVVIETNHADGGYWIHAMTGKGGQDYARAKELTRIGSIRKKVKRLKAQMDGGK